jgi:hypothetical protein
MFVKADGSLLNADVISSIQRPIDRLGETEKDSLSDWRRYEDAKDRLTKRNLCPLEYEQELRLVVKGIGV